MRLRLMVNNTADLNGGAKAAVTFDEAGGVIGSAGDADWVLSDRNGTVEPHHLRIMHVDGGFCVEVLAACGLRVNGASSAVKQGDVFKLLDGNTLEVGRFQVAAYVTMTIDEDEQSRSPNGDWARRFMSVEALVGDHSEEELTGGNFFEAKLRQDKGAFHLTERLRQASRTDPVELIDEDNMSRAVSLKDPVAAFDQFQKAEGDGMSLKLGEIINLEPGKEGQIEVPDDLQPGSAYVALPRVKAADSDQEPRTADMDTYLESLAGSARNLGAATGENLSDAGTRDRWLGNIDAGGDSGASIDHVLLRPLCEALGLPVQAMSLPQADQLARDIGGALKAAIAGLMAMHQRELSGKSHLAETHLHAIEDNPLRLDQSVEEAVRDLFLVQSPVHLSAASAIGESLELLRHHQQASEAASNAALDRVLQALAPQSLARRFTKYKGHAPRSGDLDAWHWTMYQHYFAEIRSDSQGGLSRMFWEVYSQVYDREMRQRTMED